MKKLIPFFILTTFFAQLSSQSSWSLGYLPFFRDGNGIYMLDNNTIVTVGGNETNDVIRATNKSINGGQTWDIFTDVLGSSWLRGVTFTSPQVGFATGYEGALLKTLDGGDSWSPITLSGNFANRDYNAIVFTDAQTGYLAGGNKSNDSIQTILKTTDGGANWNPQRDALGFWLKDIFFIDANTGFAVGERGVVLKTTNGGTNWNPITLAGNAAQRTYNAVWFVDANTGIMVGGNRENDSIQTILRTTDGGNNWSIIRDSIASWLNDVQFYDVNNGYAVGDDGTLLKTTDKGLTWTGIILPDTVNVGLHLHTVFFANEFFGTVTGRFGTTMLYRPSPTSLPQLQTAGVTHTGPGKVLLRGTVNNIGGQTTQALFEYGTNLTLTGNVNAAPANLGAGISTVAAMVSGLSTDTLYYYRVKATSVLGTFYSTIDSFYATGNDEAIPNWNFELWDSTIADIPLQWRFMGGIGKVVSFDGGSAVEIKAITNENEYYQGVVLNGLPAFGQGGVPFTARPDSMIVYLKYNVDAGDTAMVIALFKSGGQTMGSNFFPVTGNSGGNFVRRAFALSYDNANTPDSLVVGFTNRFADNDYSAPGQPIAVDKISFIGTSQNVPNSDFENWTVDTVYKPVNWVPARDAIYAADMPRMLDRSDDRYLGHYALEINSPLRGGRAAVRFENDMGRPTFALKHKPIRITGFYKYTTSYDTADISITVFSSGQQVANGFIKISQPTAGSGFEPFQIPIQYYAPGVPDSASFGISIGNAEVPGDARMILDALAFDAFVDSAYGQDTVVGVSVAEMLPFLNVYPNPSTGLFTIVIDNVKEQEFTIEVMDVVGKVVHQGKQNFHHSKLQTTIDLSSKPAGVYFICLKGKGWLVTKKVIKSLR